MTIDVCQYMRPRGLKSWQKCEINDSFKEKYELLISLKGRVSAEVLQTGDIALYLEQITEGYNIFTKMTSNGPSVISAIEEMLEKLTVEEWNKRLKDIEENQ